MLLSHALGDQGTKAGGDALGLAVRTGVLCLVQARDGYQEFVQPCAQQVAGVGAQGSQLAAHLLEQPAQASPLPQVGGHCRLAPAGPEVGEPRQEERVVEEALQELRGKEEADAVERRDHLPSPHLAW